MKSKTNFVAMFLVWLFVFGVQSKAQQLSKEELNRRTIERRAVEAVIWACRRSITT
jgi:hypothetical protein